MDKMTKGPVAINNWRDARKVSVVGKTTIRLNWSSSEGGRDRWKAI